MRVGVVWTFLLSTILSSLSPSLWETARYRLKYCLKGPLNPNQPTNQKSTTYQLLDLYNTFCKAVDSGKEVRAVFCDIIKAFDRVWHKGLIHKLRNAGFAGKILEWCSDYISNRRHRVVLNGSASGFKCISADVPQGSILGPFLFLIYINDIVETLNCNVRLFADDTSLYVTVDKSRKENPQKLTQLSSRSHPRHLVGKRTAQKTPS